MKNYIRSDAINYAKKWAYSRNPKYYAFDKIGGDCTNFISQCLYEGSKTMNYTPTFGWYYINPNNRSPSWTGVEFLYNFLINNKNSGPFAKEVFKKEIQIGDVIQLGNQNIFYHSLLVVNIINNTIYTASHDFDAYMKKLSDYNYEKIRYLHIIGVN